MDSGKEAVSQSDQMRASGSGRRKVALPPGRSQLDWVRDSRRLPRRHPRRITLGEVRKHNARDDAWMIIQNKVYDVTPYVEYHPGGIDMIVSAAGKVWMDEHFCVRECSLDEKCIHGQ